MTDDRSQFEAFARANTTPNGRCLFSPGAPETSDFYYTIWQAARAAPSEWAQAVQGVDPLPPEAYAELAARAAPAEFEAEGPCKEADGCPTELAVLQRFWREQNQKIRAAPAQPLRRPDGNPYSKPVIHADEPTPAQSEQKAVIRPAYMGELNLLRRLLWAVDELPLHAHKRAVIKTWLEKELNDTEQAARAAPTFTMTSESSPVYLGGGASVDLSAPAQKLWLWKNGDHFLAFDHEYPCFTPGGDPMTLGEPVGYAIYKSSHDRAAPAQPGYVRNAKGELMEADHEGVRAAPAQHNAERARSMAEYKNMCPATSMQQPHDWRYASSAPGWMIGDACARCQRCEAQGIKPVDGKAAQMESQGPVGLEQGGELRAAPAQPAERVLVWRQSPDFRWAEVAKRHADGFGQYAWATIERIPDTPPASSTGTGGKPAVVPKSTEEPPAKATNPYARWRNGRPM